MLVEFSVGNYRSFKDTVTLSMVAANISSKPKALDEQNIFTIGSDVKLLTSAAVYGANASGKSNLIAALRFMRQLVLGSSRDTQNGFEVNTHQVVAEGLYRLGSSRESVLFRRDAQTINVNTRNFREGKGLEARTRPNALFLSVVAQFNGAIATKILTWFRLLGINTGVNDPGELFLAYHGFENSSHRQAIEQLIKRLDVGIESFAMERVPASLPEDLPTEVAQLFEALTSSETPLETIEVKTAHRRYDAKGRAEDTVVFDLQEHESTGTQRLFALAHPLIHALREGRVLVIDELDARIHPNLVIELVRLFNSSETNPRHAQLIFTTHNTNLLSARLFRRDQIWFVEKSRQGASELYSLVEYRIDRKVVRNDASFEKDYIAGRYGAIPFIGDLSEFLGTGVEQTTL